MQKEKKPYPIRSLWHWYHGNYCVKKCRDEEGCKRSYNCWQKMEEFCDKNPDLKMTHKEFLELVSKHMNVCIFDENERRRMPTWKEVVMKEGECPICKALGVPQW